MKTVHTVEDLRRQIAQWRIQDFRCAIVPTMGALHQGHLSLVEQALRRADRVIVTVFVNPKQFAANEDLATYPRDHRGDSRKLGRAGAHLVFMPDLHEMYPEGFATEVRMSGPALAGLEDRHRPHFFDGVATVVAKLLIQAGCDYAMFGEKDYQQLKVVTRLARDLDIPTNIVGIETVREPDGLAMSSRNAYLTEAERALAPQLHATLCAAAERLRAGEDPDAATAAARTRLEQHGFKVDYCTARNAESLDNPVADSDPIRLLAAAWLGKTRLIDNIAV